MPSVVCYDYVVSRIGIIVITVVTLLLSVSLCCGCYGCSHGRCCVLIVVVFMARIII